MKPTWRNDNGLVSRKQSPSETSSKTVSPGKYRPIPMMNQTSQNNTESHSPNNYNDSAKEASWQSLQRALNAAKAAQRQRAQESTQVATIMLPSETTVPVSSFNQFQSEPEVSRNQSLANSIEWSTKGDSINDWTASSPNQLHGGFDFGFDQPASALTQQSLLVDDNDNHDQQQSTVSPEDWQSSYSGGTPQAQHQPQQQSDYSSMVSPPMPLPVYPSSRRGSGAEALTNDFGSFALQGTSPRVVTRPNETLSMRPTEGEIDIASRRKRPRPAALTSSSLRSRSYGQLSSASPALRASSLSNGQLRHAKSAGHNLNTQYAGIRKSSIQQKSPFNIHSFAEADAAKAEAFENLMAQQVATTGSSTPQTAIAITDPTMQSSARFTENTATSMQPPTEVMPAYKQLQSPPITPFQQEFMMQASGMGVQSNISAASQFANFADYTPPYSAGPLTNSTCSWSDAPLHSPELTVFPSGTFMSSLGFNQESTFPQWVLPSDNAIESGMNLNMIDDKKTEFYITEFPGQKEEHLNVFQKISQQKPKNYVFANTAPSDYDS